MQAQADLAQIPVDVYPSLHATALGAAACAHGARPALAPADAVGTWTPVHTYRPQWSADRAADYLHRWRQAAESTLQNRGDT